MKFEYDDITNDPPAPFLSIRISHPARPDAPLDLRAKVDTGADISALPNDIVNALRLAPSGELRVAGYDGQPTTVTVYAARVTLPDGQRGRLNVLTVPTEYALLGRDLVNHLRLLLDGPAHTLEVLPTSPA